MRPIFLFVCLFLGLFGAKSDARRAYATAEAKPCIYCHNRERGGGPRNYRGEFYKINEYSFAEFDDAAEAKIAGAPIGPEALPPPKSYTPKKEIVLPPDTPNPAQVPDFGIAMFGGIEFVKIPAGSFRRGTTDAQKAELEKIGAWTAMNRDETPARMVRVTKPFFISRTEVTQKQWQNLMANAVDKAARKNPSAFKGETLPLDTVSYADAQLFCREIGKRIPGAKFRLPTEAEWEYAARAGSDGILPLGDDKQAVTPERLKDFAWYSENSGRKTNPVATKKPNAFGLYDMLGNVWEWCSDAYAPDFYAQSPDADPFAKPAVVNERVLRGGSWYLDARAQRPALRGGGLPTAKTQYFGIRLVREL